MGDSRSAGYDMDEAEAAHLKGRPHYAGDCKYCREEERAQSQRMNTALHTLGNEHNRYQCDICDEEREEAAYNASDAGRAEALYDALDKLIKKLDVIHEHPAYRSVWTLAQVHSAPYEGPTYIEELAEARRVLHTRKPEK